MQTPEEQSRRYEQQVQDVKILQKINRAHRGAFMEKFPGSIEHILRLLTERLQLGLDKRDGVDVTNPDTWLLSPEEIQDLALAMNHINQIRLSISPPPTND
jgi:hypothetical protein